jgi:hypothetical protein
MTTTIRLRKETVDKINALDGKSQDDKINRLLQNVVGCSNNNVVKCSNPSDAENEILTNLNLLLKAFNCLEAWHTKIETALKTQQLEITRIREAIESRSA